MKHFAKILSLGAALALAPLAYAVPISGSFSLASFGGTYIGGTATAATATGLDFGTVFGGTGNGYGTNGSALIANGTGSFLSLNGTNASIADISLGTTANPFTGNPFLSFGTNSPIVINFSNATIDRSTLGSVAVAGSATFSDGTPADTTLGTFTLSTSSQGGSANSVQFTFTSNVGTTAAVTPEPSSLVLLGSGLVSAAGMLVRRRRTV